MQLSATERRELEEYADEMFATGRHLVMNFEAQRNIIERTIESKTKTIENICRRIFSQSYSENVVGLLKHVGQRAGVLRELGFETDDTSVTK